MINTILRSVKTLLGGLVALTGLLAAVPAYAAQPVEWQVGLQPAVTPIMRQTTSFHDFLLWIITATVLFVLVLLVWVVIKYNRKANPEPSKTTHHTMLEVVWTIAPVIILVVIATKSFPLLFDQLIIPDGKREYRDGGVIEKPSVTVKTVGYQWYWGYVYPDSKEEVEFDSVMLTDEERAEILKKDPKADVPRLLAVDYAMVVPVNKTIRLIVTADPSGVIHSYAMPAFGVKIDAVPGRINETWFRVEKEGTYYGQCSELCGKDHAFMPIAVKVVPQAVYEKWLAAAANDMDEAKAIVAAYEKERQAKLASAK